VLRHRDPAGTCEIQLSDDGLIRSWSRDELLEDLALVITLSGTAPVWP
jgi:hypothetical protein